MAEEKTTAIKGHVKGCQCGACQGAGMMGCDMCWGHGYRHHGGMHMVIRIFLVLFVFWAGVEFGELKEKIRQQEFGGFMMGRYSDWNTDYSRVMPMMGNATVQVEQVATSSKKK